MINGHSLVGLSHQEAVAILRSTAGLVQLVVASRVSLSLQTNRPHTLSIIVCQVSSHTNHELFLMCSSYKVCQLFKHIKMSQADACSS